MGPPCCAWSASRSLLSQQGRASLIFSIQGGAKNSNGWRVRPIACATDLAFRNCSWAVHSKAEKTADLAHTETDSHDDCSQPDPTRAAKETASFPSLLDADNRRPRA